MAVLTSFTRRIAAVTVALFWASSPAAAQDLSPVTNFFTTIGTALTGPLGQAIGFVVVCFIGLTLVRGRFDIGFVASAAIGLVVLFGAGTILSGF